MNTTLLLFGGCTAFGSAIVFLKSKVEERSMVNLPTATFMIFLGTIIYFIGTIPNL